LLVDVPELVRCIAQRCVLQVSIPHRCRGLSMANQLADDLQRDAIAR